jgi:cell division protein FtsL
MMLKQRLGRIYEVAKSFDLALRKNKIKQNANALAKS